MNTQAAVATSSTTTNERVLRVLSGAHSGAEPVVHGERILVGNLENECDIVLDVGREERHACLVRTSSDGWSVLAIAGDLWTGTEYLAPQNTRDIQSGTVLTLGRVAFCVAHSASTDWHAVKAPVHLSKPEADGAVPSVAMIPTPVNTKRKWMALKLAAGVGTGVLSMASASAYLAEAWATRHGSPQQIAEKLVADQSMVEALPFGKEIKLNRHPDQPRRVLATGYVPTAGDVPVLQASLQAADTNTEMRVVPLDQLKAELVRRLPEGAHPDLRYVSQGRFATRVTPDKVQSYDKAARMAMQELPALAGLDVEVKDIKDGAGKPLAVTYARSSKHAGDVLVGNLDEALGRNSFVIKEVRTGANPSLVLDDGVRYFVGAKLIDGSSVKSIDAKRVLLLGVNGSERAMPLGDASVVADLGLPVQPRAQAKDRPRQAAKRYAANQRN
jgi:Inner membrane component of T3SS, cytoplasmic domain